MFYIWLLVVILLAIIECLTVNLTTIWFVVSGLIALFVSFFTDQFFIQFAIFLFLGIILLITTKSWLEKIIKPKSQRTNLDRVIGMEGIVTENIQKNQIGEVKVDGKKWSAFSSQTILKDETVIILDIDGVKLKVEKKEEK